MNYNEKQIETLKEIFFFTDREARFIYLVANATGYFLRRHIISFFNTVNGKAITKFIEKLRKHRFIKEFTFANRTKIYHLTSKKIYSILEQENSRFRKKHENVYISKRLLLLSFIIQNLDKNYLFTENDKIDFFTNKLGVKKEFLPYKIYSSRDNKKETIRYFVDKNPIIFSHSSPVVHFIYPHSGLNTSLSDFETYLNFYQDLFSNISELGLYFLSSKRNIIKKAEEKFRIFLGEKGDKKEKNFIDEIWKFFELKEAKEQKNYVVFQGKNASWYFENERNFNENLPEELFIEWRKNKSKEWFLDRLNSLGLSGLNKNKKSFIPYFERRIDEVFEYSF